VQFFYIMFRHKSCQSGFINLLQEVAHVLDLARENKMTVNLLKTVELVFRRPNIFDYLILSAMSDVGRVAAAKLLGFHLKQNLNFSQRVDAVVTTCNQGCSLGLDVSVSRRSRDVPYVSSRLVSEEFSNVSVSSRSRG